MGVRLSFVPKPRHCTVYSRIARMAELRGPSRDHVGSGQVFRLSRPGPRSNSILCAYTRSESDVAAGPKLRFGRGIGGGSVQLELVSTVSFQSRSEWNPDHRFTEWN